ncbi:MAG: dimethylargininase [Planctomycetes bacterium]|nr:dimethylargininase [Planctomycetota bacterium]
MTIALTRWPSPRMTECQLTYLDRAPLDLERVVTEHAGYCQALAECGARVTTLAGAAEFPDCTFIEDTAVVLDELALICRLGTASRQGEEVEIARRLETYRRLIRLTSPATLEGGDVLRVDRTLFVGLSSRTNAAGIEQLAEATRPFGYTVRAVPVTGCLHFKTACTALPDGRLLVNPEWIDTTALRGCSFVSVPESEPWGANLVCLHGQVIAAAEHEQTIALLGYCGVDVHPVKLGEFARAEGGATCLSLLFTE